MIELLDEIELDDVEYEEYDDYPEIDVEFTYDYY